ncbi:MAG: flagellar assembly protein FliH [Gammaproteobacteria bacterium]|nr:flagellar assembly protein FliH [Gammaproteobacteria bacterium]
MSSVLDEKAPINCTPWRAPDLNVSEEIAFDYKLTDTAQVTHRDQQTKIRQQAYEKRYAKGYMEGLAQGQQEVNEHVTHLHSLMATLIMPLPDLDDRVVDEMAQLCIAMVRQLVRRELKTSPDEIIAVTKEALSMLPETPAEATLDLHPEDAAIVRKSLINPDLPSSWKIIDDPLLTRGGCRVSTKSSRIDATVESRLNAVIAEVMGDERN